MNVEKHNNVTEKRRNNLCGIKDKNKRFFRSNRTA